MFNPEVLPFDEVTELPIHHFTVQDFFYHPFLFSVDDLRRWRGSCMPSRDWVVRSWSQFYYIEHRVDTAHRRRQTEAIYIVANLPYYGERS